MREYLFRIRHWLRADNHIVDYIIVGIGSLIAGAEITYIILGGWRP